MKLFTMDKLNHITINGFSFNYADSAITYTKMFLGESVVVASDFRIPEFTVLSLYKGDLR